jgi:hypothetical protein
MRESWCEDGEAVGWVGATEMRFKPEDFGKFRKLSWLDGFEGTKVGERARKAETAKARRREENAKGNAGPCMCHGVHRGRWDIVRRLPSLQNVKRNGNARGKGAGRFWRVDEVVKERIFWGCGDLGR